MKKANHSGFTLIGVMIVVAIVGILATIATPTYMEQMRKTRRADAKNALLEAAARQERFYSEYNTYTNVYTGGTCTGQACGLNFASNLSPEDNYQMSITAANTTSYTLQAAPQGDQANDRCGNFTLNSLGQQSINNADSGVTAADCW